MTMKVRAAFFVVIASFLWGAATYFPLSALGGVPSPALTFYEHLIGLLILLPFVTRPSRRELRLLCWRHLPALFLVGVVGEILAGLFYGDSFRLVGGAAAGFLQMLQPFFVLGIVWILRMERQGASYVQWAFWVFFGALALWIFDPGFDLQKVESAEFFRGAGLGLLAVFLWAASNVAAKTLLEVFSASSTVFFRWSLSLLGLGGILWINGIPLDFAPFFSWKSFGALILHASVFSLLPLWLFYQGLRLIPASLTTFIELVCPLTLLFWPAVQGTKQLHELQWLGGLSVVLGVVLLVRLELEFIARKRQ